MCLLDLKLFNRKDSSVGGSSAGSQEDSSSLTDSTADNTPDALDVRAAGSTKTTQTAPITPAQTTTNPRSYVADKVPTALETSSIKSFRASGVPDDRSGQNIVATSKGYAISWTNAHMLMHSSFD